MPDIKNRPSEGPGRCEVCGKELKFLRQHQRNVHKMFARDRRQAVGSTALVSIPKLEQTTITVLDNFQVITDGKRIGLVDWSFGDRVH